jgi:hypothetical protein
VRDSERRGGGSEKSAIGFQLMCEEGAGDQQLAGLACQHLSGCSFSSWASTISNISETALKELFFFPFTPNKLPNVNYVFSEFCYMSFLCPCAVLYLMNGEC